MDVNRLGVVCPLCGSEETYFHSQSPDPIIWCADGRHEVPLREQPEHLEEDMKQLESERMEP